VISQAFRDVENSIYEVLKMRIDGSREVHHMPRVTITVSGKQKHLFGYDPAGASGDLGGADHIDVEWQMRAVLLDGATRENADLAQFDGVVDLGPGEFFVAIFGFCLAEHREDSVDLEREDGTALLSNGPRNYFP
jgi:hypothetical protein